MKINDEWHKAIDIRTSRRSYETKEIDAGKRSKIVNLIKK